MPKKKTTDEKIDDVLGVLQDVIRGADKQFTALRGDVSSVRDEIAKAHETLDRIEYYVNGHDRRLDVLEDRVRQMATKIGIRFN